jgi:Ca-activated chloride channel homolog
MTRTSFTSFGIVSLLLLPQSVQLRTAAQDDTTHLRVNVVLVQLNVAVTDDKGNYVTGLRPEEFSVVEDKIPQKVSTFEESTNPERSSNEIARGHQTGSTGSAESSLDADPSAATNAPSAHGTEANVFVLFDTSNYMYRTFVYAQDAIVDFIRSMDNTAKLAFYSYSRDLSRMATLTSDQFRIVSGVRNTVAGDDAALYNSLLLTVKDTAPLRGRKAIVVFSNGPDNASSVPPEDVAELAQSTGTIIYIVSTQHAQDDPISAAAFERVSKGSGGKAYFAKNWKQEKQAFAAIREDLFHLYTLSYYPQPNPNRGWRSIKVRLVGKDLQKYHIRTRDGYRLMPVALGAAGENSASSSETVPK